MILLLYVNDLFLTGGDELIIDAKRRLIAESKMNDLGIVHYLLCIEVWWSANGIFLGQGKYAVDILNRFRMMDCRVMATPMASNLKLLSDASSKKFNAMMYH